MRMQNLINAEITDTTGTKRIQNMEGAIGRWDKVVSNIEASNNEHNTATKLSGDEPINTKVTAKSRRGSEDGKIAKNFVVMNMQNIKKKNNFKADTIEPVQNNRHNQVNNRNELKTKAITTEKNLNFSNANELESMKIEMENLNNNMEQLNDNFKSVTAELSDEKKNNTKLLNSLTATLNKYENLESSHKIQEQNSYKEQLNEMSIELKNVLAEKNDILHSLEESELALAKASQDMDSLKEEHHYKLIENAEKLKTIEKQSHSWNAYQIELEKYFAEGQRALSHKDTCIKQQEIVINNLKIKLSKESKGNIQRYTAGKLSATTVDAKNMMVEDIEVPHNKGISGMRNRPEKLIAGKTGMDNQPNMNFDLSREISPPTGKYRY